MDMVTQAARPRLLTLAISALLALQAWLLASAVLIAARSPGRPAMVPVANALATVLLLGAMLVSQRHRRIAWALIVLSVTCIVTAAIVIPRMQ